MKKKITWWHKKYQVIFIYIRSVQIRILCGKIYKIWGFDVTIHRWGFAGTINMSRNNSSPVKGEGCCITYEILVEVDMYPRRSNTFANVDKFTQNRGCEGKAHNWDFAVTIHTLRNTLPRTPSYLQTDYKAIKIHYFIYNIILRKV